jgi:hypothetical protein
MAINETELIRFTAMHIMSVEDDLEIAEFEDEIWENMQQWEDAVLDAVVEVGFA